jgi:hypothetical protein
MNSRCVNMCGLICSFPVEMADPNIEYISEITGVDTTWGPAPANFSDASDSMPTGAIFDIGGHGANAPYSMAVNAIVQKHMEEIRAGAYARINMAGVWKKRLSDFIKTKNNTLLDFLSLSLKSHSVLGPGETLLRRFGNPQITPNHPSVKDIVLDISGEDVAGEINERLAAAVTEDPLKSYEAQTILIFDEYRKAGDKILDKQNNLKGKLEKFDRIQGRLTQLFDIDPNDKYDDLMTATEAYLKKIFEENAIEDAYKELITCYRRFVILREMVQMSRSLLGQESEPICSICLDDTVSYALTPCGHTLCQTCMRRQNGNCFMCRVTIRDKVKIYFG